MQNSKQMLSESLTLLVVQTANQFESAKATLDTRKTNRALAEGIYKNLKAKYDEGLSTSFELLEAENDWITAQTNYFNAYYDVVIAKTELEKALGK